MSKATKQAVKITDILFNAVDPETGRVKTELDTSPSNRSLSRYRKQLLVETKAAIDPVTGRKLGGQFTFLTELGRKLYDERVAAEACDVDEVADAIEKLPKKQATKPKADESGETKTRGRRVDEDTVAERAEFGAQVVAARNEQGKSRAAVAKAIGVSGTFLNKVEKGITGISDEKKAKLVEELGL